MSGPFFTLREQKRVLTPFLFLSVGLSADGKTVATRGLDDKVRIWNSATGAALGSISAAAAAIALLAEILFHWPADHPDQGANAKK